MHRTRRESRGFSLVEVIIVSVLIFMMAGAVASLTIRGQEAQAYVEKSVKLNGMTQDVIEMIRKDVSGSTRFFVNNAEGTTYLTAMDRSAVTPLGGRLPILDSSGIFEKDVVGGEKTGNILFFAMLDRADTCDVGTLSPELLRTDIFRFVCYYLRSIPGMDPKQDPDSLDLVKWVSQPMADWTQIEAVSDPTKRQKLLLHLYAGENIQSSDFPYPPVRFLWRQGDPVGSAFAKIASDGSIQAQGAGFVFPIDLNRSKEQLMTSSNFAIVSNVAEARRGLARFGVVDTSGAGFPHGFEVQAIGPASARQILVHLTTVSRGILKHRTWVDLHGVSETRDL